ncbi:MAG: S1C family serine protease, partial [Planctomycetaceae bacterium]
VGADPLNDIAVIRIEAPPDDLHPVEIGDSRGLRVGMRVFAIGNPFGLERTLTTGVISSLDRTLEIRDNRTIKSIIQIDAAINPGSSGGPLLDSHGRLIGINTAIASKTGQSAGVGFSIPVSIVARLLPQLISRGRVIRPEIGIAKVYQTERGLLIYRLAPGGPAERDGLRGPQTRVRRRGPFVTESEDKLSADLIIGVDGQTIQTADDFLSANAISRLDCNVVRAWLTWSGSYNNLLSQNWRSSCGVCFGNRIGVNSVCARRGARFQSIQHIVAANHVVARPYLIGGCDASLESVRRVGVAQAGVEFAVTASGVHTAASM